MIPEPGFYALAGHATAPRQMLARIAEAEDLGLGAVFLSERWNVKEAGALPRRRRSAFGSRPPRPTTTPGTR